MPPKSGVQSKSSPTGKKGDRNDRRNGGKDQKTEEVPPSGPIIRSTIMKATPPVQGMSYRDAINPTRTDAASKAAPASAESSAAPQKKVAQKAVEVEEPAAVEVAAPVVQSEIPMPANANSQFSWAEDEYTYSNPNQDAPVEEPEPEPEPESQQPQLVASYPESVINNRSAISFKAPGNQLIASAFEQLQIERQQFEKRVQDFEQKKAIFEKDMERKEANLATLQRECQIERENLVTERQGLVHQQNQLKQQQQQQQQQQPIMPPPASMNPSMPNMHHQRSFPHGGIGYSDWEAQPYDMYGFNRPGGNPRQAYGRGSPRSNNFYPSQYNPRVPPGPQGGFAPPQNPRTQNIRY